MDRLASFSAPRLQVWGGVASAAECAALIDLARSRLTPSTVLDRTSGASRPDPARTSNGAVLRKNETQVVTSVTARIAGLLHTYPDFIESLHVTRYGPGEFYLPHQDWFDPNDAGSASSIAMGQRTGTFILYLNTPTGGATRFPESNFQVNAVRGNAVQFEYPNANIADRCLHGGDPVAAGEKLILTAWKRDRVWR